MHGQQNIKKGANLSTHLHLFLSHSSNIAIAVFSLWKTFHVSTGFTSPSLRSPSPSVLMNADNDNHDANFANSKRFGLVNKPE